MKVIEMELKVYLKKDILLENARHEICSLLDYSFAENKEFLNFHKENKFKYYVFSLFYPIEKDKIYKEGQIYTILIRTVDEKVANFFIEYLEEQKNDSIKALTIQSKVIPQRHLERIYSLTPVLGKFENGYWKSSNITLNKYEKRLKENVIKKYNQFFNVKINEDFPFIKMIKMDNKFPISCPYKNIHLLGDKITIILEDNDMAQQLGYFLLGVGLGELNSRGFGMLNYQYLK